jgi:hypothetical protein
MFYNIGSSLQLLVRLASGGSTVVEHLPRHAEVRGSIPKILDTQNWKYTCPET